MSLALRCRPRLGLRARVEAAYLLEAPERDVREQILALEGTPLFGRLVEAGAISINPYSAARFAARRFAGYQLRESSDDTAALLDGRGDLVELIKRLGADTFEREFLAANTAPEAEVSRRCAISEDQVGRLRDFVDSLYIRDEFASTETAPAKVYSSVAAFTTDAGRPVIGFFDREIWKGRYRIDSVRRDALLRGLAPQERGSARALLTRLALIDRRKTTLYSVLELLLEAQAEYILTGDIGRRRALSQRDVASRVGVCPSVINRLIGNKAVEMPWGVEIPLKAMFPTGKAVLRDKVFELSVNYPALSDNALSELVLSRLGTSLSRQSINDYRRESGLSRAGARAEGSSL